MDGKFFELNKKKLAIFIIILTFIPMPIFMLLCGGAQPVMLFIYEQGLFFNGVFIDILSLFLALLFSIPGVVLSYLLTHCIYKIIAYFHENKSVGWFPVFVILVMSIIIFFITINSQGVTC